MAFYSENLAEHMNSQNVDLNLIQALKLYWPANGKKYMWAKDDREKKYRIYVSI